MPKAEKMQKIADLFSSKKSKEKTDSEVSLKKIFLGKSHLDSDGSFFLPLFPRKKNEGTFFLATRI